MSFKKLMLKKLVTSVKKDVKMNPAKGEEILTDFMLKRAVNKSHIFTNENYKERWFVLDGESLKYYDGSLGVSTWFAYGILFAVKKRCFTCASDSKNLTWMCGADRKFRPEGHYLASRGFAE